MRPVQTSELPAIDPAQLDELFKSLGVQAHPLLTLPALDQARAILALPGGRELLIEQLRKRQRRIELSNSDPLNWGFEAETWKDADRLLTDCDILAIFGGNRAQKTYYAVRRAIQTANTFPKTTLVILDEKDESSVKKLQTGLVWPFLRPHYAHLNGKRHEVIKINYTQGNGFTDGKIVLPNGSEIYFLTYGQDPGDYEGWEFGVPLPIYNQVSEMLRAEGKFVPPNIGVVADESMPLIWLQMFSRRIKFRQAKLLWPFTPVKGITPAVKELVGSSAITIESRPSELLPRVNRPDLPAGHMPYICRCNFSGARATAIYFFTEYNKWGPDAPRRTYYDEVKALCEGKTSEYVERIAYGLARDNVTRAFPKFGPWNVVKRSALPAIGTNYSFHDPAGARNWASLWVRVAPGNPPVLYIYRDWPDAQTFGEWATPTEREVNEENRKGWDGDPGPAQNGLGYGITKYKQTFLECERVRVTPPNGQKLQVASHNDLVAWMRENGEDPQHIRMVQNALVRGEALDLLQEEIAERYVDPRAGASEHQAEKGGTCIIDEFEDVQYDPRDGKVLGPSMELIPASGVNEDEGLTAVNELLDWNQEQKLVPILNQPHLFVCEDCLQVIWMFENFTGRGGSKGACKDFADLVRYMALAKLEHVDALAMRGKPGRGF